MSNLSTEMDTLKADYRRIFLKVSEEFSQKIEKISQPEFEKFIREDVLNQLFDKQLNISEAKKKFSCLKCATCCRLACSEFSYDELKEKAQNGDNFAQQFISTFIPYDSEDEPQKIYPEYFELLKEKAQGEKVYFYHCPKVTENNCCPDYEKRPQICRDFPDNPIGFLPKGCGFTKWKQEVLEEALTSHAIMEIVEFYKKKLH